MRERGMASRIVLGEIAVRVDDRDSLARADVGHGEIEEERALARAGFPCLRIAERDTAAACKELAIVMAKAAIHMAHLHV